MENSKEVDRDDDTGEELVPRLENAWTFYHDKFIGANQDVKDYENSVREISSFSSIPKFWMIFNNLPSVDSLQPKSSLHLMKKGIKPLWEDPHNANGGFWAMRIEKSGATGAWKELVLACIGEQFAPFLDKDDDISGLTISVRVFDVIIQLWNRNKEKGGQLIQHIKHFVPKLELRTPYYKACRDHAHFKENAVKQ